MNNQHAHLTIIRLITAVLVAVIGVLVSLIRYQNVIPTGTVIVDAVLSVILASCFVLGWQPGTLTLVLTAVATTFLKTAHWPDVMAWIIAVIIAVWLERIKFKDQLVLSHRALILLGLTAGLTQLLIELILYAGIGWQFDGGVGLRAFVPLVVPSILVNALLTALLTAPFAMLLRWIMKKVAH